MLARTARVPAMRGALPDDAGDVVATFGGPFATHGEDAVFADPFLDGPGRIALRLLLLRDAHLDVLLEQRRHHHEDDEEHQHDVDHGHDIGLSLDAAPTAYRHTHGLLLLGKGMR